MSLPRDRQQGSLFGVWGLVAPLFAGGEGRGYVLFAEQVMPALDKLRPKLEALYAHDGRPGIDPVLLAGVLLLQFRAGVGDREAALLVRLNLGWKCALRLGVEYAGFHHTTLVYFRQRLWEAGLERVVFDAVLGMLGELGLVRHGRQRLDSTHIVACVARMSRLQAVRETLRLALEGLAEAGLQGMIPAWELLRERYCDTEPDWRRSDGERLQRALGQCGEDGYSLLECCEPQEGELPSAVQEQLQLLQRVLGEQFSWGPEGLQSRRATPSGAVQNPHDPEAQWSCKDPAGATAWVGYKVQVMETVPEEAEAREPGEPTAEFITEITTTEAIASDLEGMQRVLEAQQEAGQPAPAELYVDAAYVTDDTLYAAQQESRELVGPARPSPGGAPGFRSEDFEVDNAQRTATCPAGKRSRQCSLIRDTHHGTEYYRYEWGSQCDGCALQRRCTKAKSGRRTLVVGVHHDLLQARRREMQTPEFGERMKRRNAIEGSISELKRGHGMGRTPYRGLAKTTAANYLRAAGCNVKRWLRRSLWEMDRGLVPARA